MSTLALLVIPISAPIFFRSSTSGLTPVASITMSVGSSVPPTETPFTLSLPVIDSAVLLTITSIPFSIKFSCTTFAMSGSNICGRTCGKNSIILQERPRSFIAAATSNPIKPAPIIIADFEFLIWASIAWQSLIVLTRCTPFLSTPLIGGLDARDPVAMIKLS